MLKPYISLVIPTHNSVSTVVLMILDAKQHFEHAEIPYEIIIADDHSVDATVALVLRMASFMKTLTLHRATAKGFGVALRLGMSNAKGRFVFILYPERAATVLEFHKMWPYFAHGAQVVVGSRAHPYSMVHPPLHFFANFARMMHNLFIRILCLTKLHDTESGVYCMRREVAEVLLPKLRSTSYGVMVEMFALIAAMKFRTQEVSLHWENRAVGNWHLGQYVDSSIEAGRIRLGLWKGDYQ